MTTKTDQALNELDAVLKLLEAKLPANPEREENIRLARKLERDVAEYFRQLEMALPLADIEALYYKRIRQE